MKLSTFFNEKDNDPKLVEASWEGLVDSLKEPRRCACSITTCHRSDCAGKLGPAWNPAHWAPGETRKAATTLEVCAFVIDFDKVKPELLEDLLGKLATYKIIVHGSHSDHPTERCLRAIVAMNKSVPGKLWPRFWDAAMQYLEMPLGKGGADPACKDASRIFFLPSRPYDACHEASDGSGYTIEFQDGELLDVDYILENVEPEDEPVPYSPPPTFRGAPTPEAWETAVEALSGGWPDERRNDCQLALCGALAHAGWPVDLIADFVTEVCERAHSGNGDRKKRLKSARYSVEKVQRGEPVTGWPGVIDFIDPETVGIATDALRIGPRRDDQAFSFLNEAHRVVVTRDEIERTLRTAKNKLGRSQSLHKQMEGLYISRALKGESFSPHPDEDQDKATIEGIRALTKYAPRGTSTELLVEYVAKSRPDIGIAELCNHIEAAKNYFQELEKSEQTLDEFKNDQFGNPITTSLHNYDIALRRLNIKFFFDSFARKKIIEVGQDDEIYRDIVEDNHLESLMIQIDQQFQFFPSKDKFYMYCGHLSRENSFHPVRDYLDSLEPWDGVRRTDSWLIEFGGAPDTPYVRAVSRIVLTAAVRRVYQPGCKFDEMMILESPQGLGKSTALKTLCPNLDWFSDNFNLDGDSKRMIEQTSGKWIIEAGELNGMSARDHNGLKQYLSSPIDEARMSYARESTRRAREFIIIGTTNDTQYLRDHTGDRRYWPIRVQKFDVESLAAVRDQLWAEALFLHRENPEASFIRLDPALYNDAAIEQSKRRVDNPIKIILEEHLGDIEGRILTSDAWKLVSEDTAPNHTVAVQISKALQELGWEKARFQVNKKRQNYYARGDASKQVLVTGNLAFGITVKLVDIDPDGNPIIEAPLHRPSAN
jgi:predicted P-loop ATPase